MLCWIHATMFFVLYTFHCSWIYHIFVVQIIFNVSQKCTRYLVWFWLMLLLSSINVRTIFWCVYKKYNRCVYVRYFQKLWSPCYRYLLKFSSTGVDGSLLKEMYEISFEFNKYSFLVTLMSECDSSDQAVSVVVFVVVVVVVGVVGVNFLVFRLLLSNRCMDLLQILCGCSLGGPLQSL